MKWLTYDDCLELQTTMAVECKVDFNNLQVILPALNNSMSLITSFIEILQTYEELDDSMTTKGPLAMRSLAILAHLISPSLNEIADKVSIIKNGENK